MADKRINALANTAPSTASDDFIAVDGTTNGTRKLSAFSPTFGGNATVTGTLTAGGGILSAGVSGSVTVNSTGTGALKIDNPTNPNLYFYSNGALKTQINYVASSSSFVVDHADQSEIKLNVFGGGTTTVGGRLLVSSTTASTTTSTGALVVGNGTSGGLGVGGSVNIGGRLTVGTTALSDRMFYVSGSTGTTGASQFSAVVNPTIPNTVTTGAYGLYLGTNIAAGATVTNSYSLYVASPDYTGSTITNKYGLYSADTNPSYFAGKVSIADSTASTSTSSGALVVSGGVGVAGAIYAGGNLGLANSSNILFGTDTSFYRSSAGALNVDHLGGTQPVLFLRENGSATASWFTTNGLCYFGTATAQPLIVRTNNTAALTITSAQKAEFASTIKTAAPSGGTAAEWKLGTVATVSPTSPNRTIEVDIGGTIYYLAAKTTNN